MSKQERESMKVVIAKAAFVLAALAAVNTSAVATPCEIVPGTFPPVCKPTGEVPEPSSPLLFLAAAAVAGVVLKIRKK
jgi:hypothetical protein